MRSTLTHAGRVLWHGLTNLLYPPACLACRRPLTAAAEGDDSPHSSFCIACVESIRGDDQPTCPHCACNVGPHSNVDEGCGKCRNERFAFKAACRLGVYEREEGILRGLILRLKSARGEALAELLGEFLAFERCEFLTNQGIELVVPIPPHWSRRLWRGYNQSEAIARGLTRHLHIPLITSCLKRVRRTKMQIGSTTARKENVRGAFRASGSILKNRTILLVDDVMTTGATLHESARTLRDAGAACVVVAVLARTEID